MGEMKTRTWSRTGRGLLACAALMVGGCHERKPAGIVPGQVVRMDSEVLDEFYEEIQDYVRLRQKAVEAVPPMPADATADQIAVRQRALTKAIVDYRRKARQGEIFKPEIEAAFRHVFKEVFDGPEGPAIISEIKAGNPKVEGVPKATNPTQEVRKPVQLGVNVVYPDAAPFSSVPPSLLLKIPALPDQVRYRFVGRALIVRDTEANVILDFIRDIVPDSSIPR
jgi:hypothetical protein